MAIVTSRLASRIARSRIGVRRISGNPIKTTESAGNVITRVYNLVNKWGNLLIRKTINFFVQVLPNTATRLWGMFVRTVSGITNFNFSITDAELDKQIAAGWTAFYGSLGGTLGNALGWAACGILPATVIGSFNEAMGLYILKEVGEEALEEISANVGNLCRLLFAQLGNAVVKTFFKKARAFLFPGRKFTNDKPWILADKFESKIESISNEQLRSLVEQFFEEAFDACIEAGYVVAGSIDSFLAMQRIQKDSLMGRERVVEITLDRSVPDD